MSRLVNIGRSSGDVDIVQPPPSVWRRIHAELGLSDDLAGTPRERNSIGPATVASQASAESAETPTPHDQDAVVTPLRRRVASRWWLVAAAALVLGFVAGIVGSSLFGRSDAPRVLAEAVLKPFPKWAASGSARVEENSAGSREIVVSVSAPGGGLREVWLLDPDTSGLVSLGLLSGTSGTFSIPADLDLRRYSVVDVSEEPDDGNPAHSGDSIVRGPLSSA